MAGKSQTGACHLTADQQRVKESTRRACVGRTMDMQIVDLMMAIEGVQEIGDGGSGGKRAYVSVGQGIADLSQAVSARCKD
jgi:hypothetical protein